MISLLSKLLGAVQKYLLGLLNRLARLLAWPLICLVTAGWFMLSWMFFLPAWLLFGWFPFYDLDDWLVYGNEWIVDVVERVVDLT